MEYHHIPVLLAEVLQQLNCNRGSTIVDCTLGGAGHTEAILKSITPEGFLLGIDADDAAIEAAQVRLARFSQQFLLVRGNFSELDKILTRAGLAEVDGFLFDLGLSSAQIDAVERGFTYKADAPLDMRMDRTSKLTAAEVVNRYEKADLTRIIRQYGEERWASRVADFIAKRRSRQEIKTSGQLVDIIKQAIPASARRQGGNPAKRTFQALRIEVNQELTNLKIALDCVTKRLRIGGRVVIISYHSLEDRIVKDWMRQRAKGCICPPQMPICVCGEQPELKVLTAKAIRPTAGEIEKNPRARSARLRAAQRI